MHAEQSRTRRRVGIGVAVKFATNRSLFYSPANDSMRKDLNTMNT